MATSKRPVFPEPPLEIGVAQYPTPLVPNYADKKGGWGINDQGHIILVEKVSIEKGTFNPQPLDGSVTYTGRDANKWPSTLYLVSERPTEDSQFIYRYWANDRSLSSQDLWNYGVSYQDQNPDYPIFTRVYITPRSSYSPVTLGSIDPVFGGTAIVTNQEMQELPDDNPLRSRYVAVKRTYETIPGPVVSGFQFDDQFQANLSISKQTIPSGYAQIPSGEWVTSHAYVVGNTVSNNLGDYICAIAHTSGTFATDLAAGKWNLILSYKDEPIDSTKSQRVIVATPSLPPTRTEYKTGTYTSPLLVFNIYADSAVINCGAVNTTPDVRIKLTPNTRAQQSRQTIFKEVVSYSYGPPEAGDHDILITELKQVAYTGYVINFNLGGALCDHIVAPDLDFTLSVTYPYLAGITCTIAYVGTTDFTAIGAPDNNLGTTFTATGPGTGTGRVNVASSTGSGIRVAPCGVYEKWDISATTPSATAYQALIGTYQKISWNAVYWKANIWQAKSQYVLLV
jgi:hypothetical protein